MRDARAGKEEAKKKLQSVNDEIFNLKVRAGEIWTDKQLEKALKDNAKATKEWNDAQLYLISTSDEYKEKEKAYYDAKVKLKELEGTH